MGRHMGDGNGAENKTKSNNPPGVAQRQLRPDHVATTTTTTKPKFLLVLAFIQLHRARH